MTIACCLTSSMTTHADEPVICPIDGAVRLRTTCYTAPKGSVTADGSLVREGICAYKPEYLGQGYVALMYSEDGSFLGYFEVKDTGFGADSDGDGVGSIQEGKVIDVYRDSLQGCQDWIDAYGDYCWVLFVKGVG